MLLATSVLVLLAAPEIEKLGPVPAAAARIFLVRHGQAFSNLDPEPDLPPAKLDSLTDLGHAQARAVGAALKGQDVSAVLSSPAGRARGTAEDLRDALKASAVGIEPLLRPLDLGRRPDGKPLDWDQRIADWSAGRDPTPPGGESLESVGTRVLELVMRQRRRGQALVFVAHGEVIGSFLGHLQGTPAPKRYPPKVRNGSITVIDVSEGKPPKILLSDFVPAAASSPRP
jgi:probable phosphoglycerate mutase